MAAAAKHVQLIVTSKEEIGKGRAIYHGTALGGTEYETGGTALEEDATSRYALPSRWDTLVVQGLLVSQFIAATQKLKFLAVNTVTAKKSGLVEYETGETMASLIPAGTPFWGIGLA